jgi:glycosyltransferase involved in cell wall biosynthesis
MRIFHIIVGLNDGGAEATLFRLISYDRHNEHFVYSLTDLGKYAPLLAARGCQVVAARMPRGKVTLKGLWRMISCARNFEPNVIQTWMYHSDFIGGILGRIIHVPVVWGIHNTILVKNISKRSTILVAKVCAMLSGHIPARIIACAEKAKEVHCKFGYQNDRFTVIPNGYDLTDFQPDQTARFRLDAELGIGFKRPVIGMVARFDPYKDHVNLLEALANLRSDSIDFVALLVGSGIDDSNLYLKEYIISLGLEHHIKLLGHRTDIPTIMSGIDVHVLSSSAEAFPNVLAEAMACATPCVSTNVGDASYIIGDCGWIVPPQDPAALARSIKCAFTELRENNHGWQERRRQARNRIKKLFSIDIIFSKYNKVWLKVSDRLT